MGVRSSIGNTLIRVGKAFGPGGGPQAMTEAARGVSQMGPDHSFSPGEPVSPYDGYNRTPRVQDFRTGYNIATRPRTHERVSFDTLRGLIDSYDVASICIWHKIDTLRGLRWKLLPADGCQGDVSGAIELGTQIMRRPDGIHGFRTWFGKWFYDVLAYDAAPLYRLRNRAGRVTGLMPFDGTTLAPLLDYWGNPPMNPGAPPDEQPEAYVQYVNGLPWNWLTRADVIYEPFRAVNNSPYGKAPIESIILNANTDLRFQVYFLEKFTEGNLPAAFAAAPETWSPGQIETFQAYWDSYMYSDQSRKHQIQWMPAGAAGITWSNEKDFTDGFSLFLMRKSCACYHIVPTDLGFTETSNYSSGESQADVQHKAGELPPMEYSEEIFTRFLYDDIGLPVKFEFDRGEDQDDRLVQAQADDIYIKNGSISASKIAELRFGESEPAGQIVPRYIFTERSGPVPLAALMAVAGKVDPETGAPAPGSPLPHEAFTEVQGVISNPPVVGEPLAEQEYGPKAIPPAPPPQPVGQPVASDPSTMDTVAKEGEGAPTAGITSDTGIYGDPLIRDEDDEDQAEVAKAEMAAFRRFEKSRKRSGQWRDFEFRAVGAVQAHNLNDAGRLAVRKAAGEVAVAGLAVQAADTGRVLMLQRALDPDDPAGGTWEMPGGHAEDGETPLAAAWREWAEETGAIPPPGTQTGTWTSANGIYQGFVWTVDGESSVPVRCGTVVSNPDDPDGDSAESIAWWEPSQLPGNPAVRPELLADIDAVMSALGAADGACCGCPDCCANGCCQGAGGCPCGPADVAKAGGDGPKAPVWAGWRLTDKAVAHWASQVTAAATSQLTPAVLAQAAQDYLVANPQQQGSAPGKKDRNAAALAWLTGWLGSHGITLDDSPLTAGIATDGYLIGSVSADAVLSGSAPDLGGWKPGDTDAASRRIGALEAADGLAAHLAAQPEGQFADGILAAAARALASADGGSDHKSLGKMLAGVIADAALAAGLVFAAVCASIAGAAADFYRANAPAETFTWVTDPTLANCAICLANEAAPARQFGEPWPSGDTVPPAHDRCGCALVR